MVTIGMVFQPTSAPEDLVAAARAAERHGVPELWLWEDCFKQGGLTMLTAALAATERLRVGIGVLPMPLRAVSIAAMEVAAVERLFPGRGRFGFGHGVQSWMGQAGVRVASPLTLMREYLPALRALLAGEEVSADGRYVRLDRVRLDWPPAAPVPVLAAGEGPKTVTATGAVADGIVMVGGTTPPMVRDAMARIGEGRESAGRSGPFDVVVYLMATFGDDAEARLQAECDAWRLPEDRRFGAAGDDAVIEAVERLALAGATSVVLQAPSADPDPQRYAADAGRIAARFADAG